MTQGVYSEPKISIYPSYIASQTYLIASSPVFRSPVVLQATVGSGEDLAMRLLLCEMYASGKRYIVL